MGVDFNRTFGAGSTQPSPSTTGSAGASSQPQAQVWANIGYTAEGAADDGSDRFVSLPLGIPVDTMQKVKTNSRNDSYVEFVDARNELHEQVMAVAAQLAPGEERILNLQIQLRRVSDERAPTPSTENRFARPLDL